MAQLCVNTWPATKVTLITDGIYFGRLRVKLQTPMNNQEESIWDSERGESLKSRTEKMFSRSYCAGCAADIFKM
jgi:hypothetical protein